MSNKQMIERLNDLLKEHALPHKYRVVIAWCIAKLMKEKDNGKE